MALGYQIGPTVMMQLGSFQFGIATAAYQELQRTTEWRWPSQDRFGKMPTMQYTGPGADTITLPGVIYPEWNGGVVQLDAMRALGEAGEPHALVGGDGASLGKWVVERVSEGQTVFAAGGVPRRMEFTLELRRFPDEGTAAIEAAAAAGGGVAIPAGATGALAKVQGLAGSVSSAAGALSGTLAKAAAQVQATVGPYTAVAREALGAVNRSLAVVGELQSVANQTLALIGVRPIEVNALLGAENLAARANRALSNAESASAVLRTSSARLAQIAGVPSSATRAMQTAQAAADSAAKLTRDTAQQAGTIKGN
jgi:phage protein U